MNIPMSPEPMDNVDLDIVMFCENIFDAHIPDDGARHFGGPLEMEEWLEQQLSSQRPNQDAAELLRMLAEAQQQPELAEGLDGAWRREQISALVRDIFRKRASPIELALGRIPSSETWDVIRSPIKREKG